MPATRHLPPTLPPTSALGSSESWVAAIRGRVEGGFKGILVLMTLSTSACGKVADSASQLASAPLSPAVEIATKSSITGKVMLKGAVTTALRKLVDVGGNPFCTGHGEIVDVHTRYLLPLRICRLSMDLEV